MAILLVTGASGVIVARLLGPSGRGILAAVTLWPAVVAAIGSLGVLDATSYFAARGQTSRHIVLGSSAAVLGLLAVVLIGIGIPLVGAVLGRYGSDAVWLGRLCLIGIPLTLFATAFGVVVLGTGRTGLFNVLRFLQPAAVLIGALVLLAAGSRSVGAFVSNVLIAQFASAVAALVACLVVIGTRWTIDRTAVRAMLTYGSQSHVGYIASVLNLQLGQLLMSMLLAPDELGLYIIAISTAGAVLIFPSAMVISTFPRLAGSDAADKLELLARAVRATLVLGVAMAVPLTFGASGVISLLYGEAYLPAAGAMRILLIAAVPLGVNTVLSAGFKALNHPLIASYAEMLSLAVAAVLMPVLLLRFGAAGAAIASLLSYGVATVYLVRQTQRQFQYGVTALIRPRRTDWAWVVAQWQLLSPR